MATAQLPNPEKFDFRTPSGWPTWFQRFQRFRSASGLSEKDEEVQVDSLLYAMGSEGEDILKSFSLSAEDAKKYDAVTKRFEGHFVKRRNTIYERARFNLRRQQPEESVDSFITALYTLVEHCGYSDLRDEMIRDRIVVGLRDARLSEKLQLKANLKLEDAIKQVRNSEAVKSQQSTVRTGQSALSSASGSVDALRSEKRHRPRSARGHQDQRPDQPAPTQHAQRSLSITAERSAQSSITPSLLQKLREGGTSTQPVSCSRRCVL